MNYLELYNIFPQFKLNMPTRRGLVEFPNLVVWHVKYRFIIIITYGSVEDAVPTILLN